MTTDPLADRIDDRRPTGHLLQKASAGVQDPPAPAPLGEAPAPLARNPCPHGRDPSRCHAGECDHHPAAAPAPADDGRFPATWEEMPPWHHSVVPEDRRFMWWCQPEARESHPVGCGLHGHYATQGSRDVAALAHLRFAHGAAYAAWPCLSMRCQTEVPCRLCLDAEKARRAITLDAFQGERTVIHQEKKAKK